MNNTVNTIFEVPGTDLKLTIEFTFEGNVVKYEATPTDALRNFDGKPEDVEYLYTLVNMLMESFQVPSENVEVSYDDELLPDASE